jgi:two-component system sensor histidine kinase KdpD
MRRIGREAVEYAACALLLVLVTAAGRRYHINATTAGFAFLLVVMAAATLFGLVKATLTSIAAVMALNYFFFPPIGTLTIQDPQNWVAFSAFFITAITASQLSGRARAQAREAGAQRTETERLFELSRAILVDESATRTESMALAHLVRIFRLKQAEFFDAAEPERWPSSIPSEWIRATHAQTKVVRRDGWLLVPVQLGGKYVGTLALEPERSNQLTDAVAGSIANLVAIGLERRASFERVSAAEAARRSDELRTALLDGLAHDLKTPLTAIKTSATALLERERADAAGRELLGIISEEVNRLQDTVGEAIEAGRIESGKFELRTSSVNVTSLLKSIIEEREDYAARVRLSIESEPSAINADAELLRLAIRQLLDNAIRYSPDNEPVLVAVRSDDHHVCIHVRDYGPGISEAERTHIFEKYYQGAAGRQIAGGTGLGLAVAKRVIEAHGGNIALDPTATGSVFVIRLQCQPRERSR